MSNIFSTEKQLSAVDMSRYGIGTVVLTDHEGLDKMMCEYATKPDGIWCGGRGKKHLHKMLHKQLLSEDNYFNKNPKAIQQKAERWSNFMDDCIIYATLNTFLFKEPIALLHPQCYAAWVAKASVNVTSSEMPTLIEDVSVLQ